MVHSAVQGLADPVPYNNVTVAANVATPEHLELAAQAAREGAVLLKNEGGVLPLNGSALRRLALIGPNADYDNTSTGAYIGNYPGCVEGPGGNLTADPRCHVSTLRESVAAVAAARGFTLAYARGCDVNTPNATGGFAAALAAAAGADVILFVGGLNTCQESACSEGEAGDRMGSLDLPGSQLPLLQALYAAYAATPIVLVLLNGGPLSSPWAYDHAAAVLEG